MGDFLIRNIDDGLKRQLQERARRNGRSVSDEAVDILRRQVGLKQADESAGSRFRSLLGRERLTDDELDVIADFRTQPDRPPPRFEE